MKNDEYNEIGIKKNLAALSAIKIDLGGLGLFIGMSESDMHIEVNRVHEKAETFIQLHKDRAGGASYRVISNNNVIAKLITECKVRSCPHITKITILNNDITGILKSIKTQSDAINFIELLEEYYAIVDGYWTIKVYLNSDNNVVIELCKNKGIIRVLYNYMDTSTYIMNDWTILQMAMGYEFKKLSKLRSKRMEIEEDMTESEDKIIQSYALHKLDMKVEFISKCIKCHKHELKELIENNIDKL